MDCRGMEGRSENEEWSEDRLKNEYIKVRMKNGGKKERMKN